ncbi:pyrimidine utilization protein D [Sphingomonas sp. AP4-R1]|uniref:pyrimidine utilization protein D n=1 Tax=Sphingomonas sp. AP4-R1 TaxID=2735134 RepID=UPI001493996D|nr:pyrimidine utilization protein D [Sphingomonas sp. AP4-R1]QJU56913.1 pyrimidine utilization protein D [Sphingomonas sp. AP4-R1]
MPTSLHHEWHGPEGAPVLILSSGLGGSTSYWAPNLPALTPHYRILAYDHRGTGRSERALPRADLPDAGMTDDLLQLMDETGTPSATIIGHAAGAMIAMALAARAPERVTGIVAINGWAKPDPHFLRCFAARLAILHGAGPEAFLRAQPIFLFPANWISAHTRELEAELPHQIAAFPGAAIVERRIAALAAFDITPVADRITAPVQVLVSEDDMLVPSDAGRRLAALLPNAELAALPWGGHAVNVTDPEGFAAAILPFLARVSQEP